MHLKSIVVAVVFLQIFDTAYSLKCYDCRGGDLTTECELHPEQEKFVQDCANAPPVTSLSDNLLGDFSSPTEDSTHREMQCVTVHATLDKYKPMGRWCLPKKMTCVDVKKTVETWGIKMDDCALCDTDLCNTKKL